MSVASGSALFLIALYRLILSPIVGGACRFEPTCSEYASQAFRTHGFFQALRLVFVRISKCRPGGPFGPDPLPECECYHGQ